MAKNQMTGKVAKVYDIVEVPTKDGKTFNKREMILDCTIYDRYTGEPQPNYVLFEFSGQKCDILNQFSKGDRVTVSFVLQGSVYKDKNTQQNKVITHIVGYEVVPFVEQNRQAQQPSQQQVAPQQNEEQAQKQAAQEVQQTDAADAPSNGKDGLPF